MSRPMTPRDLAIGFHKLDTEFFSDHVQHTTFQSNASLGMRKRKVVTNWYRKRELGRGGFGTVWLEMSDTRQLRAVKAIRKGRLDYNRELEAMAELTKHEELFVQFYGWFESKDRIHIAMEYISHGHLDDYLEAEISEAEAKFITRQLLEGLEVMHKNGFVHRDLKPQNILVVSTSPVWVKIADFGLAKLAREGTVLHTNVWSECYTAPEASGMSDSETSEYTNAVDIWSLGCVTHKMLTQVAPFPKSRDLFQYCEGRVEFPRTNMLSKNISSQGIELVEHMLEPAPANRATAEEALESKWLQAEDDEAMELRNEASADQTMPERPTTPRIGAFGERLLSHIPEAMEVESSSSVRRDSISHDISSPLEPDTNMASLRSWTAPAKSPMPLRSLRGSPMPEPVRARSPGRPRHPALGPYPNFNGLPDELHGLSPSPQTRNPDFTFGSPSRVDRRLLAFDLLPRVLSPGPQLSDRSGRVASGRRVAFAATPEQDAARFYDTPLHFAADSGSNLKVQDLLAGGAIVDTMNSGGQTPLHMAVARGHASVVTTLLRGRADVNRRDSLGNTPLHWAVSDGNAAALTMLLEAGANPTVGNNMGKTALHYAVDRKSVTSATMLLTYGADPDIEDNSSVSPRQLARSSNPDMARMFGQIGASRRARGGRYK